MSWTEVATDIQESIIADYNTGLNLCQISEKYNVTWTVCKRILKKQDIKIRSNRVVFKRNSITKEIKDKIISEYVLGSNSIQLAKKYNISQTGISRIVKKAGVTRSGSEFRRKYTLDESVFDTINPESAYWIGMLMADGSIQHSGKHSPHISLTLQERDKLHLEKLAKFLGTNRKPLMVYSSGNTKHLVDKIYFRISVHSIKLADALAKYNVVPNKVYRTAAGALKNNRDFWRGAIDGDGCIHISVSGRRVSLTLAGTQKLLEEFKEYVLTICPNANATVRKIKFAKAFQYALVGVDAVRMIHHLYKDSTIYLDRKMKLATDIINNPEYNLDYMEELSRKYNPKKYDRYVKLIGV